ncbi:protein stunted-like isoform X1 [Planococcus citri]|uniref:protein stunted-like isoform X1 n=1 Tax=Planococcus citri TaxID=170843 RepID=UPI0031F906CF
MTFWRQAGLNYIQYSNIVSKVIRRSLKEEFKLDSLKRDESSVRFTNWKDGKPVNKNTSA